MLALSVLLVPLLLRRRRGESREAYNLAVYRDQLAEIERDVARGLLNAEQAEAARTEIGRRILALSPAPVAQGSAATVPFAIATVAVLLLPFGAWLLYARLGSPALPDQPFAERAAAAKAVAEAAPHPDIGEALAKLSAHLKEHPEDLTGWLLLARAELRFGHYPESVEAYRHAVDLSGRRGGRGSHRRQPARGAPRDDFGDGRQARGAARKRAGRCRGLGPARPLLHGAEPTGQGARGLCPCAEAEA